MKPVVMMTLVVWKLMTLTVILAIAVAAAIIISAWPSRGSCRGTSAEEGEEQAGVGGYDTRGIVVAVVLVQIPIIFVVAVVVVRASNSCSCSSRRSEYEAISSSA